MFRVHCLLEKIVYCAGVLVFFWALQPSYVWAKVHIEPKLILAEECSDNFFRSEIDELAVWVTQVSPGLEVEVVTDRSRLEVDYLFSYF